MAATLKFKLKGEEHAAVPVKLERKKLYGRTETVATDASSCRWHSARENDFCVSACLKCNGGGGPLSGGQTAA